MRKSVDGKEKKQEDVCLLKKARAIQATFPAVYPRPSFEINKGSVPDRSTLLSPDTSIFNFYNHSNSTVLLSPTSPEGRGRRLGSQSRNSLSIPCQSPSSVSALYSSTNSQL